MCKHISVNRALSLNSVSSLDRLVTSPLIVQTVHTACACDKLNLGGRCSEQDL
jgi:hypothetical protein